MNTKKILKKITIATILMIMVFVYSQSTAKIAKAQVLGTGLTPVLITSDVSPTGLMNNVNLTLERMKNFVLDKLATMVVKQILHQMIMSVVNWVNSGFNGNPAFVTNPKAFFTDVADQVSGEFISENGALSVLCSPFGIDLRINLASSQVNNKKKQYACTINKIIGNVQNGFHARASANYTNNGATLGDMINGNILSNADQLSINGSDVAGYSAYAENATNAFMNGDFNQGGWPAFTAMIQDPQNSVYGATLMAQSDLAQQIAERKNSTNNDLSMGNGFMSWKTCTDLGPDDEDGIISSKSNNSRVDKKTGQTIYQTCETQTPGSVIGGSINKVLGSGQDEMVAADDINAVVNALVGQLVSVALNGGLTSVSKGGNSSYVNQMAKNSTDMTLPSISSLNNAIDNFQNDINNYDSGIKILTDIRTEYANVGQCFVNALASSTLGPEQTVAAKNRIYSINKILSENIDPTISDLQQKKDKVLSSLNSAQDISTADTTDFTKIIPANSTDAQSMLDKQYEYIQQTQDAVTNSVYGSTQDLTKAKKMVRQSNAIINKYQADCTNVQNLKN